jgi:Holliday junction resolvasome RuvABC endonuclease subunit
VKILGIDPGSRESGYVLWDADNQIVLEAQHVINIFLLESLAKTVSVENVAIERIRGYGIVAGDDTFDTCEWVGRFDIAAAASGKRVHLIPRKDIKKHLCGNTTTNDKYIRQALIDRIGEQGTKKSPGPLYGISGHLWAALAVVITLQDKLREEVK